MIPMVLPAIPFGLVLGVAISESMVNQWAAWSSSWLMMAGSAQFVAIELLDDGSGVFVVAITAWVINARHIMYSAALASPYADTPRWWKFATSYVLVDQLFAMDSLQDRSRGLSYRMSYLLGGGFAAWAMWQVWVTLGILVGDVVPSSWSLEFAIPILFLTLMVLAITNTPGVIAAAAGGITAVVAADMANGTGLLVGAAVGVVAGRLAEAILVRHRPSELSQ
jgi:predicted branched-subunit amino acid permease